MTNSPRQIHQLNFISEFTTEIHHIDGAKNIVADALSRICSVKYPDALDFAALAAAQNSDPELEKLLKDEDSSLKFHKLQLPHCDTSTTNIRPFIPASFRPLIFNSVHNLAHPGVKATVKLITDRLIWPGMKKTLLVWLKHAFLVREKIYHVMFILLYLCFQFRIAVFHT